LYWVSGCCGDNKVDQLLSKIKCVEFEAKEAYAEIVKYLQERMIKNGIDKFTARKQARGAARGFLGNALMTELIFSANIHQWKWMIKMRASRHADAEIRLVFNEVYELLNARFPNQFNNWTKHECPDGIGYELQEPV
jgi:thymidylate synthase ThyX